MMATDVSSAAADQIFRQARTANGWLDRPVEEQKLHEIYDLLKWGPTSANCLPLRLLFLRSREAKERLRPALSAGNVDKVMSAPVVTILAYDSNFFEKLPRLFPHIDARSLFVGKRAFSEETARRNASLQGGYFIVAARMVGLDAGPMSGFDNAKVDAEFFPEGEIKSNFLCNLGYGDNSKLFARLPRLTFDEACSMA